MPSLTFVKVVTREEATLNMYQERIFALQASHTEMVKPPSTESATYTLVLQCLWQILQHLPRIRPSVVPRPPVASISATSVIPLATPKRIDFRGYVHLFKQVLLSKTEECLLSDMLVKSPTTLLNNVDNAATEDDLDPLIWVHVPLNNTAWVNVSNPHVVTNRMRGD
jgi:hypothetical protein